MRTFGLLGKKIRGRHQQLIHELAAEYTYRIIELPPVQAEQFVRSADYDGINIAPPYGKMAYDLCDTVADDVKKAGEVDTIVCRDGRLFGYNTAFSAIEALADAELNGRSVLLFGEEVNTEKGVLEALGARVNVLPDFGCLSENDYAAEAIVNTLPSDDLDINLFPKLRFVADLNLVPLKSQLIIDAKKRNIRYLSGLSVSAHKTARSVELFTGKKISPDELVKKFRCRVQNIVLTGMPFSGKSTVGKIIAGLSGKSFVDTDAEIEKKAGMTIPHIFKAHGEESFRRLEQEIIRDLSLQDGLVISTGGGSVMNEGNFHNLLKNGRVYCLDRKVTIVTMGSRPLINNIDAYNKLYAERRPFYQARCDKIVSNNISAEDAAERIMEDFYEATDY